MEEFLLEDYNFDALLRREKNPRMRVRFLGLAHLQSGCTVTEAAQKTRVGRRVMGVWLKKFRQSGIDGLRDQPKSGRRCRLSEAQQAQLKKKIIGAHMKSSGGRLKGLDIQQIIEDMFDVKYSLNGVYALLKALGLSWISSRSKHPSQDPEAQETFKKTAGVR